MEALKRDYVWMTPVPDAWTVLGLIGGWIEGYMKATRNQVQKNALALRVHRSSNRNRLSDGEMGARPKPWPPLVALTPKRGWS